MKLLTEKRFVEIDAKVLAFLNSRRRPGQTPLRGDEEEFIAQLQDWAVTTPEQFSQEIGVPRIEIVQYHDRKVWRHYNP